MSRKNHSNPQPSSAELAAKAQAAVLADRQRREQACLDELAELLKRHNCSAVPVMTLIAGADGQARIEAQIQITAN